MADPGPADIPSVADAQAKADAMTTSSQAAGTAADSAASQLATATASVVAARSALATATDADRQSAQNVLDAAQQAAVAADARSTATRQAADAAKTAAQSALDLLTKAKAASPTSNSVDLTAIGSSGGKGNPQNIGSPAAVQAGYALETTRKNLAYILLALLFLVIVFQTLSGAILGNACWRFVAYCTHAKESLDLVSGATQTVFTAMIGLVGSVIGFYFGSKAQNSPGS